MDTKKVVGTVSSSEYCNSAFRRNTPRHRISGPSKKQLKLDDEFSRKNKKKRKGSNTNEKMKNIINNIEREIEEELDLRSESNDFITSDVKAILKEVIMDEDIKEMVRKTLHPGENNMTYEPKLTRAKVRELLKVRPDLSLPILWPIPSKKTNFVSECLSLINADYSENSSEDEEYKPDDDEKNAFISGVRSDLGNEQNMNDSFNIQDMENSVDEKVDLEIEENIGQRTRSKLPLNETPLEVLEQAFVPPDITSDMYETDCDNEDWCNFIKGFSLPIDHLSNELLDIEDDLDDDPEYTVQADEEKVDKEELREDKAVEVPLNEVEELIAELLGEYEQFLLDKKLVEMNSNNNDLSSPHTTTSKLVELPVKSEPETIVSEENLDFPIFTSSQKLLFDQQLRQHVQLTLMHFLQCYKHPSLFIYAEELKTNLTSLRSLANFNKKSAFYASNLDSALEVINEWEKVHADVPKPKRSIFKNTRFKKKNFQFPTELFQIVSKSDAFLYPLLLPSRPFTPMISNTLYKRDITRSEEWLLVSGLQQFTAYVEGTQKPKGCHAVIREALKLTVQYMLPQFTPTFLYRIIKKRSSEVTSNRIKYYLENKRAPPLKHFIVPVSTKQVCQQPTQLLPPVWKEYITKNCVDTK